MPFAPRGARRGTPGGPRSVTQVKLERVADGADGRAVLPPVVLKAPPGSGADQTTRRFFAESWQLTVKRRRDDSLTSFRNLVQLHYIALAQPIELPRLQAVTPALAY